MRTADKLEKVLRRHGLVLVVHATELLAAEVQNPKPHQIVAIARSMTELLEVLRNLEMKN